MRLAVEADGIDYEPNELPPIEPMLVKNAKLTRARETTATHHHSPSNLSVPPHPTLG